MPVVADFLDKPVAPPDYRRLGNGLSVALLHQPEVARAAFCVRVAAGSHDESGEYPGLAHFLEHLLFLGSAGYPVEQGLMAFVQACGGQVNASTQARHTDYFCEVPAERLGEALARLLDMLARPLLEQAAQLREREVLHAEFLARGQDADTLVATALGQALPPGHPCAAFHAGNRHTLAVESDAFQQALRAFHRRFYQAGQLSLVLVGPQSRAELEALARRYGAALPGQARRRQAAPAALLPLRAQHLRMSLAGAAASLQLGFALALPGQAQAQVLDEALDFLLSWLASESAGGLVATLRAAALCSGLAARVLYRHANQALLLLSFADVDEDAPRRALIAAALQDWLGFFAARADWAALQEHYRTMQRCRLHSLAPLALARYWQDCSATGRDPALGLSAAGLGAVQALLAQMQDGAHAIELFASPVEVADWPTAGFALRMLAEAPATAPPRSWAWQAPAANPLLDRQPIAVPALDVAARLRWLPAAAAELGLGAFHGRLCLPEAAAPAAVLALAQARLREIAADAAQVGVTLLLAAQDDGVQLALQGPAVLLPRALVQVLFRLLNPAPQAEHPPQPATAAAELPLRQLLRRLPELFGAPLAEAAALTPQRLPDLLRRARLEGLGVGFAPAGQAEVERLFSRVSLLPPPESPPSCPAGRYWLDAHIDCAETALLLFCPQAAPDAASEASWRLLAQFYQGAFYRRLRGELQLGYALFCGYRQVRGQRGILFAVQSPHASAEDILGHIEAFLQAQGECLAALSDEALATAADELERQLCGQADSPQALAERHWQLHLAGLPPSHEAALRQALGGLTRASLLHAHRQLRQAAGGWRVLANARRPVSGWLALD